jgi:hypothetical protein
MEQAGPGTIVDTDMDFSPDFGNLSDRNNPPSDHPTPSTLNSSSNTSYSLTGADDPSPVTKHQKSSSNYPSQGSFDKINSVQMPDGSSNSQATGMNSMGGRFYPSNSGSPSMPTEASNTFSMPSTWDFSNQTPAMGNADLDALNVEAFSESQWAQILDSQILGETPTGWENWRPS